MTMLKHHKKKLILSSLGILLPIFIGLLLWNQLPDQMATHWNASGEADGWSGKAFSVFALPLIILPAHWICLFVTTLDTKNHEQSRKALNMIFWIMPIVSVCSSGLIYSTALGHPLEPSSLLMGMVGLSFALIGNYLPKVKQNYTLGIKVPWALQDEENWNATHRFAGKLWMAGGVILVVMAFFPMEWTVIPIVIILLALAIGSVLYSYLYYQKHRRT